MMTASAADSDLDGNYYGGDYFLGSAGSSSSAASSSAPITNSVVPMPTILEEVRNYFYFKNCLLFLDQTILGVKM